MERIRTAPVVTDFPPLKRLGYRWVAGIAAIYVYLAAGPTLTGKLLAALGQPPAFLMQLAGVLGSEPVRTAILLAAYGVMWLAWTTALLRWPRQQFSTRRIWMGGLLFTALLLPLPPHFSDDVYGYAQHGRTLAHYGQNPYTHTLRELGDPWVQHRVYWSSQPSPYGPVLTLLHAGANLAGGERFWLVVAALKLMMAACFLLTAWFVQKILERVAPLEAGRGLFFFLWCPVALLELPGQAHNDAVMLALMTGGLWLIVTQRQAAGFVALFVSFAAKVTTAILLPLHGALLLRRRAWSSIAIAGAVSLAIAAGFYVMFFDEPGALAGLREVGNQAWLSPIWLGGELLEQHLGWSQTAARRAIQLPLLLAFAAFLAWRATRVTNESSLLRESGFVVLFFLLFVSGQMNPWYPTLLLPLAAVARNPVLRAAGIAVAAWPLVVYFRPWMYQAPFWANVIRAALLYAMVGAAMWLAWRAHRVVRPSLPAPALVTSRAASLLIPAEWAAEEALGNLGNTSREPAAGPAPPNV